MRTMSLVVALAVASTSFFVLADEPVASDRPVKAQLAPAQLPSTATVTTEAPKPLYKRWELWAVVGATVASALAAGLIVAATQPPPVRTASQVCPNGGCNGCIGLTCTPGR